GLVFDDVSTSGSDADSAVMVYLTGESSNPRVQGAVRSKGKWSYPTDARKSLPVKIGEEYTLRIRVRENLVNVAVNDEQMLAWKMPSRGLEGATRLIATDAEATISEFQLRELDSAVSLIEPSGGRAATPREMVELAKADVAIAKAELRSLQLRANYVAAGSTSAAGETKMGAIAGERQVSVERARRSVIEAEQGLARAAATTRGDASNKLKAAEAALQEAIAVVETAAQPADALGPLMGAQWTPTRFQHTGKDDEAVPFRPTSTGRRTALAEWITDRRNPLTARVAVNHLWNRHFGAPLAPVAFDLGRNSPAPSHPELLDWLASEFMDRGWSMKHLHRLIVTSSTYRMSSSTAGVQENAAKDPDNRYWWRRMPQRIEAQAVRDSILALAGTLDPKIGGPSVPSKDQDRSTRRSLYFFHTGQRNPFLATFDDADVDECYAREQSIVPQQALAMTNSRLVLTSAKQIAERIAEQSSDDSEFVTRAFVAILGIRPSRAEITESLAALERWKKLPDGSLDQARSNLVGILLNHNDFVTLR
ncbi:MAG TPA: DUF1553 domain-containing protein, partial [Caulifigura sp.]|nr:DUF1553 domain-containing protein [Caulifigura sp.]